MLYKSTQKKKSTKYTTQLLVGIKTKKMNIFFLAHFKGSDIHMLSRLFEKNLYRWFDIAILYDQRMN